MRDHEELPEFALNGRDRENRAPPDLEVLNNISAKAANREFVGWRTKDIGGQNKYDSMGNTLPDHQ